MINMLCFKKKYKRSEWMEGLLAGERLVVYGYKMNHEDDQPLFFYKKDGSSDWLWNHTEHARGVKDYMKYFEENKEILSKGLDG